MEFALDLPYAANEENIIYIMEQNNYSRDQAIQHDYQMNWKWKRRDFSLQTRCMTALYERLFGYINTKDCRKILIECINNEADRSIKNLLGVYVTQIQNNQEAFGKLSDLDKKKVTLEILLGGIKKIAAEEKWEMEPFERTYAKIVEAGYKNEWVWNKPVKSPDKKHIVKVLVQHEVNAIDIFIVFSDNRGVEIQRNRIITEEPDEWAYSSHLGEIKWLDDNNIALTNKMKDKKWQVEFLDI